MKRIKAMSAAAAAVLMLLAGCGAGAPENSAVKTVEKETELPIVSTPKPGDDAPTENTIHAVMKFTNGDEIELDLYPNVAPKTVANFVELAEDGFYDGTVIHRVVKDFVIQGGGYDEKFERVSVAETIKGEFDSNGFKNDLHHDRGVISMARLGNDPDSASSQFFIVVKDNRRSLDGGYAAFGEVTDGMDVVDKIAASKTGKNRVTGMSDWPEETYVIESITIEE